jgi:hypothetical protein
LLEIVRVVLNFLGCSFNFTAMYAIVHFEVAPAEQSWVSCLGEAGCSSEGLPSIFEKQKKYPLFLEICGCRCSSKTLKKRAEDDL